MEAGSLPGWNREGYSTSWLTELFTVKVLNLQQMFRFVLSQKQPLQDGWTEGWMMEGGRDGWMIDGWMVDEYLSEEEVMKLTSCLGSLERRGWELACSPFLSLMATTQEAN